MVLKIDARIFDIDARIFKIDARIRTRFWRLVHLAAELRTPRNLPHKGRYDVIVSHISEGPYKFFVQMKSEAQNLQNIRKKLNSLVPTSQGKHSPFQGKPLGSPCIVFSPSDELFHRGLITGMKDFGTQSCTAYIVDVGTQIYLYLPTNF